MKESELILTHILNCNRSDLYLKDLSLDEEKINQLNLILLRRKHHYPLAYLLGKVEFMGLSFKIKEGVFIPRFETEVLAETAIDLIRGSEDLRFRNLKILDIGTGCGNIAVCLAKFLPNVRIVATDISVSALDIARENAKRNRVEDRIEFIQVDIFTYLLPTTYYLLDIIISNPPYIPTKEIKNLQKEIRFEPYISIDGGPDGLDFYRRIIYEAPNYLKKKGFLILEIGFGQYESIKEIFKLSRNFTVLKIVKDYNNINRVIVARYG